MQASALWQWCNFTETLRSPEKRIVHINLDETAVKLFQPPGKGLLAIPKNTTRKTFLQQERKASLGDRRRAVSYLAFIASDPDVQKLLPQVFVASKRVVTVADARAFEEHRTQDNLFLLLRDSGWLDHKVMTKVIGLLRVAVEPLAHQCQFIVSMDTCGAHLHKNVIRAVAEAKMHLLIIPASMTGWLQPCDVRLFSKYKAFLRERCEEEAVACPQGTVPPRRMLQLMSEGVAHVVTETSWEIAFTECGLGHRQAGCSKSLRDRLGWTTEIPHIPHTLPSLEQLQSIFPTGRCIPIGWLFSVAIEAHRRRRQAAAPVLLLDREGIAQSEPLARSGADEDSQWYGRLRSNSRIAGHAGPSAASGSSSSALPQTSSSAQCPPLPSRVSLPAAPMPFAWMPALRPQPMRASRHPRHLRK